MHARRRGCCTCPVLALSCPSVITVQITLVLAVFPICCRQHMFKIIRKLMPTSEDIYISLITWLLRSHNWHQYNQKCTGGASIYGCSRILSAVLRDTKHACMSLIVLLESPAFLMVGSAFASLSTCSTPAQGVLCASLLLLLPSWN